MRRRSFAIIGIVSLVVLSMTTLMLWQSATAYLDIRIPAVQVENVTRALDNDLMRTADDGAQPSNETIASANRIALLARYDADQTFFDDLTVESDQAISGDVLVYSGDVRVKNDGRIEGNLVVYSGDIRVDEGGEVSGNVSTFAGDVRIAGEVGGNLTTFRGDITLRDSAVVGGDISVLNGDVERSEGARVGGDIIRGPSFNLPAVPVAPFDFDTPAIPGANSVAEAGPNFLVRLGALLLRIISALVLAFVVGLVLWLIAQIRPSVIQTTHSTLRQQAALSFVVGIVANMVLLLIGGFFAITICLLPVALISYAILLFINVVGWAALSSTISQRFVRRYDLAVEPDYSMAVTAILIAAAFGLLWAFGGCFRFFGFATMLVVSSIGAGAVLLPFVNKHLGLGDPVATGEPGSMAHGAVYTGTPTDPMPTTESASPSTPAMSRQDQSTEQTPASPSVSVEQVQGLGQEALDKLQMAGITTCAELAELSHEEIGEILGWSPERVKLAQIKEQAKALRSS